MLAARFLRGGGRHGGHRQGLPLGPALVDVFPALAVDGEVRAVKPAQVATGAGLGGAENGKVIALGIEFFGEGQTIRRAEIDAEGTSLADFRPDEDRTLARALFVGGVTHRTLFQANLDRVLSTFQPAPDRKSVV